MWTTFRAGDAQSYPQVVQKLCTLTYAQGYPHAVSRSFGVVFLLLKQKTQLTNGFLGWCAGPESHSMIPPPPLHSAQILHHCDLIVCGGQCAYDVVAGFSIVLALKHLKVTGVVVVFEHLNNSICLNLYVSSMCVELYKTLSSEHVNSLQCI